MFDYAWIISADRQSSLGITGVSSSYILPSGEMNSLERELAGSRIWIFLRGQQDRCIAAITVKRIERFAEGFNDGDFLIYTELMKSIRLCSNYGEARRYSILLLEKLKFGLNILDNDAIDLIRTMVSQSIEIKFTAPTGLRVRSNAPHFKNNKEKVLAAVSQVVQNMNLNQIWGSGTGLKLNPVANFAADTLSNADGRINSEVLSLLRKINPIGAVLSSSSQFQEVDSTNDQFKVVDLSFTEIVPENIYAREFVSGMNTFYDLEAALSKTDVAEKRHQYMLRDISEYLRSIGVMAYESTSIDLLIEANSKIKLFELKSVNNDNLMAQAAKGVFQIASYATAITKELGVVHTALIINKIQNSHLERFVLDSLKYLSIDCLIYNSELPWPERLPGLLD